MECSPRHPLLLLGIECALSFEDLTVFSNPMIGH